jgi:hypothetical protein
MSSDLKKAVREAMIDYAKKHKHLYSESMHAGTTEIDQARFLIKYSEQLNVVFARKILSLLYEHNIINLSIDDFVARHHDNIINLNQSGQICVGPVVIKEDFSVLVHKLNQGRYYAVAG